VAEPSFTDADPALLGAVLSAMRVGVALLSPEGTLLHLNPAGAEFFDEILGRGAGWSVVGRSWDEAFGPDGSAEGVPPFGAALDGGSGATRPRAFRSPSGRYWNISLHGLPQGAFATFDEELAHTARHQQELTLVRQAVAALDVGVSISDARRPDCPLIFINDGFTRLTGYPATEALGRNCRFLQGPDTNPAAVELVRVGLIARTRFVVDILNYRKDGTPFLNRLRIRPIFDERDEVLYYIGCQNPVG